MAGIMAITIKLISKSLTPVFPKSNLVILDACASVISIQSCNPLREDGKFISPLICIIQFIKGIATINKIKTAKR